MPGGRSVLVTLPNSAHLQNVESFVTKIDPDAAADELRLVLHTGYSSVHPMVIAMLASLGAQAQQDSRLIRVENLADTPSIRYLQRMGLFDALNIDTGITVTEHEPAGRFRPLAQVQTSDELNEFIVDVVPLLHADPNVTAPIKYAISELVRNVLEHARCPSGAMVCAQVFRKSGRLAIGVADTGMGIRESLSFAHDVGSDEAALRLALRPGITGTTKRVGGTEYNAGAGLFFMKAMACASRNHFVAYSGSALFKLRKTPKGRDPVVQGDPDQDYATRHAALPTWSGTAMGLDLSIEDYKSFNDLLGQIRKVYSVDVRQQKKAKYKPRFVS
jgi:anti-sigma regulatory factor (Ser/Thr protein kinase)